MNTFFRGTVVAAVICVVGVSASENIFVKGVAGVKNIYVDVHKRGANAVANNFGAGCGTYVSRTYLKKDQRLLQSFVRGSGRFMDKLVARERQNREITEDGERKSLGNPYFLAQEALISIGGDYAIDKVEEYLHGHGITVESAVSKCDVLTDRFYFRTIAKEVVRALGNGLTEPQAILGLTGYYMPESLKFNLEKKMSK